MKGVILAGGSSTRFGSFKGDAQFFGRPAIAHIAAELSKVVDGVFLNGSGELNSYGLPLIHDKHEDQGPLQGMLSCFEALNNDIVFVSCDMPFVSESILCRLVNTGESCCFSLNGRTLPFPGVYTKTVLGEIPNQRSNRMLDFIAEEEIQQLKASQDEAQYLRGFNTKEEYELLRKQVVALRLHGQLAELNGQENMLFLNSDSLDTKRLKSELNMLIAGIEKFDYKLATNGQLIQEETTISGGSTIEVMPPFSGG